MKIRIEGCTQQELDDYCGYLTVGKDYEVSAVEEYTYSIIDDDNSLLTVIRPEWDCPHIPANARWVEVTECCTASEEDLQLLREGSYTPEELWGGSRPTCPKCIDK